jgi:mRNA interferase RelE/StbE
LPYRLAFTPRAEREFKALDRQIQRRLARHIDSLAENPYPRGIKKLAGEEELYRLRVGNYRIIYQVHRKMLLVLVVGIGHRSDVYRRSQR